MIELEYLYRQVEKEMDPIIEVKKLSYTYPESESLILNEVDLKIEQGSWVALVGRNGSGKSTLARLIDGLLEPLSGEISVDSLVLNEENIWQIRQRIGMVFQNPDNQFVGATVEDDVAFGLENRGLPREEMVKRVTEALEQVKMSEFRQKEPSRLSGGQKQRVALAGVIAMAPKILILDEATSMLDPEGRKEILAIIQMMKKQYGLTIISITHDIEEVMLADKMVVLQQGRKVLEGCPLDLFVQEGDLLAEYGLEVPFTEQLKQRLRQQGLTMPEEYVTIDEMVEWLWKLNSKM